jgi:hypothetical protein
LTEHPEDARSVFCLAQTYFDSGDFVNARKWYARRVEMGGSGEEVYIAMLRVAESMRQLDTPFPDVQDAYLRAWEFRPARAEALWSIAKHCRAKKRYLLGYLFAKRAAEIPLPETDKLFVRRDVHAWRATDEQSTCGYRIGKEVEAFTLRRRLLARPDIPTGDRRRIATNRDFSVQTMIEAASSYPDVAVGRLIAGPRDAEVTVSLIAGPDRETTEQTLNSFLHCCTDVSQIGRFLVLDAGLSAQDRARLRERYRFLEFADPSPGDGPGAQLAQLRAKVHGRFWLHLGQGWQFFAPDNLITRLTAVLKAEPQVFQVGINLADAAMLTSTSAAEQAVRRAPDAGRYVPTDMVASGPAMFDTARLDQAGALDSIDRDPLAEIWRRGVGAGLQTASLDEVLCINRPRPAVAGPARLITIIGRGRSGTRAISHALSQSGVFMGEPLNVSADLVPHEDMYKACRVIARHIPWRGGLEWDFGPVQTMPIPTEFTRLIERYLNTVLASPAPRRGWKIPETTLCYPWITRLFPDIHYIFWVRNPRDVITGGHATDDLRDFGIEYPPTEDTYLRRAISWKFQDDLIAATPRPRHLIKVRLEDFVQHQERELVRLEEYLGFKLARIPAKRDAIGRHKEYPGLPFPEFLKPAMREHGYEF